MLSERRSTVSESQVFANALKLSSAAERAAYLDEACAGDTQLRSAVDALLHAHACDPDFLEKPAATANGTVDATPADGEPDGRSTVAGDRLETGMVLAGRFKLLMPIGEGGMGTVWMAEQTQPVRRKVAVKIIKAGLDNQQVLARFDAERQALALMDHPNIARVFDGGATDAGRPYFVMELVKGQPITKYCDEQRLTPRQRLELFVPVCEAIQHAHQKGIIHRDIKPSNVLVAPYDGRPVVKVIDFGIAKAAGPRLTEKTMFTEFGAVVGTLEYMSPEQAELNNQDIDTRSDVYSLGVLLYELLTGTTPLNRSQLKKVAFTELLRMIREVEPPKPSTRLGESKDTLPSVSAQRQTEPARLARLVRGELDWIVMKSLEKDRNRRYETANAFAADVGRYLRDEPVQACPPSLWYRFRKSARKNKAALATAVAIAAALVTAVVALAVSDARVRGEHQVKEQALNQKLEAEGKRADAEQGRADKETERVKALEGEKQALQREKQALQREKQALEGWRQTAHYRTLSLALSEYRANNLARAFKMLDESEKDLRHWEWNYLNRLCHSELSQTSLGTPGHYRAMSLSLDGKRAAILSGPVLLFYDTATGKELHRIAPKGHFPDGMAFSPDGNWLATCGNDQSPKTSVRIWNAHTGAEAAVLKGPDRGNARPGIFFGLRHLFMMGHIAGQIPVPAGGGMALPVQLAFANQVARLDDVYTKPGDPHGVAFSTDGQLVAATDRRGQLQVWDRATGNLLFRRIAHPLVNLLKEEEFWARPAFSPDGKLVATACQDDGAFKLWNARTGEFVRSLWQGPQNQDDGFSWAVFSPKGKWVAAAGRYDALRSTDPSVRVWDLKADRPKYVFRGTKSFTCLAFSPDEGLLAAGSLDDTVMLWDLATGRELATYRYRGHEGGVVAVAFTPDGKRVVSLSGQRVVRTWDATHGPEMVVFRGRGAWQAALSPDGRYVAAAAKEVTARVWDTATGLEMVKLDDESEDSKQVAFSPDGKHLAVAIAQGGLGGVRIVEAKTGRLVGTLPQQAAAPPKAKPGTNLWTGPPCYSLAYSPDGKRLVAGGLDRIVRVWDVTTGKELFRLGPHTGTVSGVAFSGDGKRLVSASGAIHVSPSPNPKLNPLKLPGDDRKAIPVLKVWDADGKELLSLSLPGCKRAAVAISPDGAVVAATFPDRVRFYDATTGKESRGLRGDTSLVRGLAFSPDGARIVTCGAADETVRLWDAKTGEEILSVGRATSMLTYVAFSRDGHKIVASSLNDDVRVWDATPLKK
jgi:WD40 repeat protein/serine/threonine protein kinase